MVDHIKGEIEADSISLREKKSDPNSETNVIGKQIDNGLFQGYFGRNTRYICFCLN